MPPRLASPRFRRDGEADSQGVPGVVGYEGCGGVTGGPASRYASRRVRVRTTERAVFEDEFAVRGA